MGRLFLLLLIFVTGAAPVAGQATIESTAAPYPCPYTNGAYYQMGVFPRYEATTSELVLVDANGAAVRSLDTIEANVRVINWSPDCHYLSGALGRIRRYAPFDGQDIVFWERNTRSVVIWDAVSGGRLQMAGNPGHYLSNPAVIWSPDSQYALLRAGCPSVQYSCVWERYTEDWLWRSTTNTLLAAGEAFYGSRLFGGAWFNQYDWDLARGFLWGSAQNKVSAYDLNTGSEVFSFPAGQSVEGRFVFSDDRTKMMVYGTPDPMGNWSTRVGVYDIVTRTGTEVNVEGFLFPQIPYTGETTIALSPDNRYLVIGHDALRIWDLQSLPPNVEDRLPIYRYSGPESLIRGVRFAGASTIQTTSDEGVQNWDLNTGTPV